MARLSDGTLTPHCSAARVKFSVSPAFRKYLTWCNSMRCARFSHALPSGFAEAMQAGERAEKVEKASALSDASHRHLLAFRHFGLAGRRDHVGFAVLAGHDHDAVDGLSHLHHARHHLVVG